MGMVICIQNKQLPFVYRLQTLRLLVQVYDMLKILLKSVLKCGNIHLTMWRFGSKIRHGDR